MLNFLSFILTYLFIFKQQIKIFDIKNKKKCDENFGCHRIQKTWEVDSSQSTDYLDENKIQYIVCVWMCVYTTCDMSAI